MYLCSLIVIPLVGVAIVSSVKNWFKEIGLSITIFNLIISLIIFTLFNNSNNQFQFVLEQYNVSTYDLYLGIDGISLYFVLLTTIIMPISILSNWSSIKEDIKSFLIIMLLLESLLLSVFLVLDILLFYIFFESILVPLFILIGIFGSKNKVRASYYLFLYTLWGSLFLLLSILGIYCIIGITDIDGLLKINFENKVQMFLFLGIFIAFAVKTPVIFLNNWLLKAHVESPLGGSIILAGIVLKLSLYGIFRLILPILPKSSVNLTYILFAIGVITVLYASISTIRTVDIKELIAYSSVCHAAVYFIGAFSNTIQGLEGSIVLGLAHGFVSSGLFISVGGTLYNRFGTRILYMYRGMAQLMPLFSILFFMLCLGNCGAPLTLNFIGEFMSLYGIMERLPMSGILSCSSIVLSAGYTIYMFNRISFGGKYYLAKVTDINKREFVILSILVGFTLILGIYPSVILNSLHYFVPHYIYNINY